MLLFQYFWKNRKFRSKPSQFCHSLESNLPENITRRELESIQESLMVTSARKLKCAVYDGKDNQEKFPNLKESMARPWVKK